MHAYYFYVTSWENSKRAKEPLWLGFGLCKSDYLIIKCTLQLQRPEGALEKVRGFAEIVSGKHSDGAFSYSKEAD